MVIEESLTFSSLRLATSEILIPVCRISSIIAAILMSSRTTSRKARYSMGVKNLGIETSIFGWATLTEVSLETCFSEAIHLKNVLTALSFLEADFGVYF